MSATGDVVGLRGPRWSFEHARWEKGWGWKRGRGLRGGLGRGRWARARGAVGRWVLSVVGACAPWWLWERLRPEHEVVARRIAVFGAIGLVMGHVVTAGAVGASALLMVMLTRSPMAGAWREWDVGDGAWWGRVARGAAWPCGEEFAMPEAINASSSVPMWTMVVMVYTPLMVMALVAMVMDGATRRGERSWWHVVRVWAFSLYPGAVMVGLMSVTAAAVAVVKGMGVGGVEPAMGLIACWGLWIAWVWWWWSRAGSAYLEMRPRWLMHVCIAAACLLAVPVGMVVESLGG